jgi:hypothetical protein
MSPINHLAEGGVAWGIFGALQREMRRLLKGAS